MSSFSLKGAKNQAFTLVELLVVIGIIAVLIGILLPALNRARASARSLACQSNLRTIGQALNMYGIANKGMLPFGEWNGSTYDKFGRILANDANAQSRWNLQVQHTLNPKYGSTFNDAFATNANAAKMRELFQCPDAPGGNDKNTSAAGSVHYYCHPRLMPQIGTTTPIPNEILLKPYRIGKIRRAPEIIVIFDGALEYSAGYNIWHAKSEVPVARDIDNHALTTSGTGAPYLLDNYTGTTKSPDDSVDMTFANGNPNTDEASTATSMWNVRFRHLNNTVMNALMADGHVQSFHYNPKKPPTDPNVTDLRRRNVYVNAVAQ